MNLIEKIKREGGKEGRKQGSVKIKKYRTEVKSDTEQTNKTSEGEVRKNEFLTTAIICLLPHLSSPVAPSPPPYINTTPPTHSPEERRHTQITKSKL